MTISKQQKMKQKILDALSDKAELSTDKGKVVLTKVPLSKKVRRHSGRHTPKIVGNGKISELVANAEEPQEEYDEWRNYRDGFRDITRFEKPNLFWDEEERELVNKSNEKIKKQLAIRKAKKEKKEGKK